MDADALLEIRDLSVDLALEDGAVHAVRGLSLDVRAGRTTAIVGESGCGKSTTALSILGLAAGRVRGSILWRGGERPVDLAVLDPRGEEIRAIRGAGISMIFQEPAVALNPVWTIGEQIVETLRAHRALTREAAREIALAALSRVGLPDPERQARSYPHELSGGMRQRAMIAIALCCEPRLVLADEPTASLDVTVQAQILELLRGLQRSQGMTLVLITHDFGVVAELADDVAVMYAGEIVERAAVEEIFGDPQHPYTRALLRAARLPTGGTLESIPGTVPDPREIPRGCAFAPRCPERV
ncbi:MAG TPA: ABC transporter ATP-binding protein, partial [bacterium]|nr:ABC transporter ATP-binding protein [bacterium]